MAAAAQRKIASVVRLFRRGPDIYDGEEEVEVGLPPAIAPVTDRQVSAAAVDLTGKPKVWFAVGPGRSGKTMLLRWAAEEIGDRPVIYAAADPQNRSLKSYIEGVAEPPTNDAAAVTRWLEELIEFVTAEKASALVDLGGGDTSLERLITQMPDLASTMTEAGVTPVLMYLLGPRLDDLASLASFEAAGFQPPATALILNEGLADPYTTEPFARIIRHSAYKAAVARGAVELRMPRLDPEVAAEIEAKRLRFAYARDGIVPDGRRVTPVGGLKRSKVRQWLAAMERDFAPVRSWLP